MRLIQNVHQVQHRIGHENGEYAHHRNLMQRSCGTRHHWHVDTLWPCCLKPSSFNTWWDKREASAPISTSPQIEGPIWQLLPTRSSYGQPLHRADWRALGIVCDTTQLATSSFGEVNGLLFDIWSRAALGAHNEWVAKKRLYLFVALSRNWGFVWQSWSWQLA